MAKDGMSALPTILLEDDTCIMPKAQLTYLSQDTYDNCAEVESKGLRQLKTTLASTPLVMD